MTKHARIVRLVILGVLFSIGAFAQDAKLAPDQQAKLEAIIAHFMAANQIPGVSVSVVENNTYEWSAGFGMADLENSVPATSQTLYRLASISKPITSTGTMLLWQQHKLDLDAPVQKYCPAFPQKDSTITTRQVLGHLGGIRHYKPAEEGDQELGNTRHFDDTIDSGLKLFANDPLVAKPGTAFHYSTQGFTLVGCVLQGASGEKYIDYVQKNVLQPAGMVHTRTDDRFAIVPYRTRFYEKDKSGTIRNADFLDSSYKVAGGGWLSSADDMAHFMVAMLTDKIVQRSTRDLMWTSLQASDGKATGYGLGWGLGNDLGVADVGHGGGQQGTSTYILMVPERKAGVVVLMNLEGGDASALAFELMKALLGISPAATVK
ncbi:MAG: beta-lactamase family protein [Acidobacteria bacterium]|nr:beta-lactamase family protein [Acidobacteriota bacterium]